MSFEIGAVFLIEDRASGVLAEISGAFERLAELATRIEERLMGIGEAAFAPMLAGLERVSSATQLMVDQVGRVADAWGVAAASVERYGAMAGAAGEAGAGGGPRGGGRGGGGLTDEQRVAREAERQLAEDRINAEAMNRNENQIYSRQEALARRENNDRDMIARRNQRDRDAGSLYGPPETDRYAGYEEAGRYNDRFDAGQRMNADAENANRDQVQRRREAEQKDSTRARDRAEGAAAGHIGGVFKGMAPLIMGISGYEAESAAMHEEQNIRQTLTALNITDDMPEYGPAYTRLHTLAYEETKGTKFSNAEAAKINLASIPVLAKTGEAGLAAAESVSPLALRLGELSAQRGGFNASNEAVAATEIAHLEQRFEPDQVLKTFDIVNAAARTTHTSILHQQEIDRYGVPTAMMMGIDPDKAIKDIASAQLRLGSTTTAGTGYSQFLLQATHFKGLSGSGMSADRSKQLHQEEREFEHNLRLESPKDFAEHTRRKSKKGLNAHDQALVDLGIYSPAGKLLATDSHGNLDDERVKEDILAYATKHPQRTGKGGWGTVVDDAFGVRGGRYAAAYGERDDKGVPYLEREREQNKAFSTAVPVAKELEGLTHGPLQEFQQMIANIANTGNILATPTLSSLNTAFTYMNLKLIGFNDWLTQHQGAAQAAGWAGIAAATLGAVGATGLAVSKVWQYTGRPLVAGARALAGMGGAAAPAVGEEVLAGLGSGSLLGVGGLLGGGMLAAGAAAGVMNAPMVDDLGRPVGTWGGRPNAGAMQPPSNTQMSVNVHNTFNGLITDDTMKLIVDKMTAAMKGFLEHASEMSQGSVQSQYSYSGMP